MRKRKQSQKRVFGIVASFLMVFSLIMPGLSMAESNNKSLQSVNETQPTAKEKMSERLLSEFEDNEKLTFLVKFKEQSNLEKVVKESKVSAKSKKLSLQESRFQQRSAVLSDLKSVSLESQQNVVEFLKRESKNGNVEDFKSYHIVNGMAITATKKIAEKIAAFAEVEKVLPNEERQLQKPTITKEDAPKSSNEKVEWHVEHVKAPEAWGLGIDGSGTVVASLDSGVQWDHPALKDKYRGYDAGTDTTDHQYSWFDAAGGEEIPFDGWGHGTHVAGTMVGSEPDGSHQIGVAPGAKWITTKVFDNNGYTTDAILLSGAEWILAPGGRVDMAPDVVTNSWDDGPGMNEWFREAVQAWRAADIFPSFSTGNASQMNPGGPESIAAPANYPESFSTGAVDKENGLAWDSLRGPSPYDGDIKPDITGPGENIRSSIPGNEYESGWNGTSMAASTVAATAAMLRQVNANISVDEMEQVLLDTTTPLTNAQYPESPNFGYGYGLVNAYEAVSSIMEGLGTLSGQVTIEGEDDEAPTFEHIGPLETFVGLDLDLSIHVSDNISVKSVQLLRKEDEGWETVDVERKSGDHMSGNYVATIPAESITGTTFTYKWVINDFGDNKVESEVYTVNVKTGITTGYLEDFESTPVGWTSSGDSNSWEWGVPTSGPGNATSGEKVYATNLAGNYSANMDATLLMPPVEVPEGDAYLQFNHWHSFEAYASGYAYDFGYIVVSTDKEEWTELVEYRGDSSGWKGEEIDLSAYSGQKIYIGFKATSNDNLHKLGWYIDDVALSATSNSAEITTKTTTKDVVKEDTKANKDNELTKLPLRAQISVLESGRSVFTNPADGTYLLNRLLIGDITVEAGAYGYKTKQQTVTIEDNEVTTANFTLDELTEGIVTGKVTNEKTGKGVEGATLLLIEDANIVPVNTDADGNYSITAYEGTYQLKVMALDYHGQVVDIEIGEDDLEINITLEPYYTYPGGEIGYDDGVIDNARAFYEEGNGYGVKMSLPEGKESAMVTEGVFTFWDADYPLPGRADFEIEVWDVAANGSPGSKIAGPISATAVRDRTKWTIVDLKEHNIVVGSEFFMVYIQPNGNFDGPGLGMDESGKNAGRSYELNSGAWYKAEEEVGNYMIRSRVSYEVYAPSITSPKEGLITSEPTVSIEGTASPTTSMELMNNDEKTGTIEVGQDGVFETSTDLEEGKNKLKAVTMIDGVSARESDPVTVTLDTIKPELTIDSPQVGDITNGQTVTVVGTVSDVNLDYVEVNGEQAIVENEDYSKEIILDEGEAEITVVAYDKAGNKETKTVTITVDQTKPVIENLEPSKDKTVQPGDKVKVSFESDSVGGEANFTVQLPAQISSKSAVGNPMKEVSPGLYEGTWTVPNGDIAGETIVVKLTDVAGNSITQEATGKLYISQDQLDRVSGEDRYLTAIETSKKGWAKADAVVIARGDDFADALAGVPLAYQLNAPVLLTLSDKLYEETMNEVKRLGAKKVIILGGSSAISDSVTKELEKAGLKVERIAGANRFDTAAKIASEVSPNGADNIVVANGMDFPDALSVASHAAKEGLPILLTETNKLSIETKAAIKSLKASQTIVVGGTTVVSAKVAKELPKTTRLAGADRYDTNIAIAKHFGVDSKHLYVATGKNYADALTGAVLAAKNDSAVLLVHDRVPEVVKRYVSSQDIKRLTIFGGDSAVSSKVEDDLIKVIK